MRNALKNARRQAGLSQQQLAVRIGCVQQSVAKHELGVTTPNHFKIIREYERALNTPAEILFPDIFE